MTRSGEFSLRSYRGAQATQRFDHVAAEEPLELRVIAGSQMQSLAVTMRTPGNDFELAAGFALGEGLIRSREELAGLSYCVDRSIDEEQRFNIVNITLRQPALPAMDRFERHFTITSACGLCGRATLESLGDRGVAPLDDDALVDIETIYELPARMRGGQHVFDQTGGLHAAALFESDGTLVAVREDVGRHNAVDKIVGGALTEGRYPLRNTILVVSGRASYEILQKAAVARIPIVCAVSAPSSLAVDLARRFNITLLGFLREESANVYSAPARIASRTMR